jgi:HK97 family phage major capsid protein
MNLAQMRARRTALLAELRTILDPAETESRDLTADEATRFDALDGERRQLDTDIAAAEEAERVDTERRARITEVRRTSGAGVATIGAEPQVYGRGSRNSYFLDLARQKLNMDDGSVERLARHAAELRVELPAREARRAQRAGEQIDREFGEDGQRTYARHGVSPFEREVRVNPNRTDGQGGYFIPPLWLVDEYVPLVRAGRPFAEVVPQFDLPTGTDSINVPKVATGTTTAVQTADGGAVSSTDLTDTFVTAPVRTIAGQQDLALQLLDQSPISFDEVVMRDLLADYNQKLDLGLYSGTGLNGQVRGIDNVSGINTATYTDGTPTLPELYPVLAQAASLVSTNRKMPVTTFLWHSRRWYWSMSQLDSSNRPLVTPYPNVAALSPAAIATGLVAEGPVGTVMGVPVTIDQNITTTTGGSSNQDTIYAVRSSDFYLWEGSMRTRVLSEVLSGTLQVRIQIYNYIAFMADRYPASITKVDGSGLALTGW